MDSATTKWARRRPVDREAVDAAKVKMLGQVRAWRLRELREAEQLTQVELAEKVGVSQNRISRIENGDISHTMVETLRKLIDGLGGRLVIQASFGDENYILA
ncbi:MAG: helix-turn-helix transcriptional regulator [Bifidobacteriaceae bacterium]|jgi:DNA-binding XRE family transcriptional regulator|nr:helix-turn-helix transcriptional regulator [Bifidobacteriaceae bacterium]